MLATGVPNHPISSLLGSSKPLAEFWEKLRDRREKKRKQNVKKIRLLYTVPGKK